MHWTTDVLHSGASSLGSACSFGFLVVFLRIYACVPASLTERQAMGRFGAWEPCTWDSYGWGSNGFAQLA